MDQIKILKGFFFFLFLLISAVFGSACHASLKFGALSHMANTAGAVAWASQQGANGVEMDLNFDASGAVKEFKHGGICDCSLPCPIGSDCPSTSICRMLWDSTGSHCNAQENPDLMMQAIAQNAKTLAVVYIDSKLNHQINLEAAGKHVIQLLDQAFTKGYKGQVIINAPKIDYIAYLKSAVVAASNSPYNHNYFFTIDGEGSNYSNTINKLFSLNTANRIYATGITIDVPMRFYTAIQLAAMNVDRGSLAGAGIWSIDNPNAMRDYIELGANMILTNEPSTLLSVLSLMNMDIARPGELLVPATSNEIVGYGNAECSKNDDCINKACGRLSAADNAPLVCCKSGKIHLYAGYDYCSDLPDKSICWMDAMCASGHCANNMGGMQKGICRDF